MNDSLSRLVWALPLVLVLGVVAILIVKRSLDRLGVRGADAPESMRLRQTLALPDGLQAHLLDIDGQSLLVLSGHGPATVQLLPRPTPVRVWPGALGRPKGSA
jgi:hypothetical protein